MSLLPPPNLRKCGVFFRRDDYWVGSAMVEAERLRDYHGLGVTSTILDVGCGVGRLLTGLVETKLLFLRYVGVDVDAAAIDWCSANLAGKHAKFVRLDIHNARYNPSGKIKMNETFMLPFETPFSIIYAWSLFTHLQLSDARAYLREFRRLLAPKGTVFLTAFCEPDVPDEQENPPHYPPRCGLSNQGRLHRLRYSQRAFGKAIQDAGLEVVRFGHKTEWNHQSAFVLQAIVAVKPKRGCCGGGARQ